MKKKIKILFVIISKLFIIGILLNPITAFAWGDSEGGRETYSLEEINNGASGDKITFNSIVFEESDYGWYQCTHNGESIPAGTLQDERNFVGAREDAPLIGDYYTWNGNEIQVEDGKTYVVRLYVDNNGPNGMAGASKNTRVKFYVPAESARTITVDGLIESSNATPTRYWDYIDFTSDIPFHLEYIYGSANLENNFFTHTITADNSYKLSDELVTGENGVLIGYDSMNGIVPGGYQYDCHIVIRVKVVYDYEFDVETQVRLMKNENKAWQKTVDARVGDKVEFMIQYKNTSNFTQYQVGVKDILPNNLRYIEGSAKIKNEHFSDGATLESDSLVTTGLNAGDYGPSANVFFIFTAEVVDDSLVYGSNTLVNWAQAATGTVYEQDYACVVVYKNAVDRNGIYKITILVLIILIIICTIFIIRLRYKLNHIRRDI